MNAELNVLGAVLLDPSVYWRVAHLLKPSDFAQPGNAAIWKAYAAMHDAEQPIDIFTVAEFLGIPHSITVAMASETAGTANVVAYAEMVADQSMTAKVMGAGRLIAHSGDMAQAQALLADLLDSRPDRLITAREAASGMWDGVMERYADKHDFSGLLTGIPKLDVMTGGLQRKRVYALGARTKMGKSMLVWQIAAHVAVTLRRPVVGFSLEMGVDELMQRMACCLSGVRSYGLLRPKTMDESEWSRLSVGMAELKDAPIKLSERMNSTIDDIEAQVRQAKPELVVIDYLQLIEQPSLESEAARLGYITRRIKRMAKECDVPVIEVFQVNRGNEQGTIRPPRPSDARGSGTIEQDCDAMLLMHRPSYYDHAARKGLELELALQRNGPTGMILMDDDLERCRFLNTDREWTPPQRARTMENGL